MISVYKEGERCEKCYSCVRSCPVKAIEVHEGWAHIIQLRQVFENIRKNTSETMPEGSVILITIKDDGNNFSLTISDTGPGISQENLGKLFSLFSPPKLLEKEQDWVFLYVTEL